MMMKIQRIPFWRWLLGYRLFEMVIMLNDGQNVVQWYVVRPREVGKLELPAPGQEWAGGRMVTGSRLTRL